MASDTEVDRIFRRENGRCDEEERKKLQRPPSSYGSMKSDSEEEEEKKEDDKKEAAVMLPDIVPREATRLQLIRSVSPETVYTMTTLPLPSQAAVFDTRSSDHVTFSDHDEDDMDRNSIVNSPEPPEPVEPDNTEQTEESSQPGRLHPEQDMPHIFKSIQGILSKLTPEELFNFKMFLRGEPGMTTQHEMEEDILDFVNRILEVLGHNRALTLTVSTLERVNKKPLADELRNQCSRALVHFHLRQHLIRKHQVIREGVVRAGRWNFLDTVYVEPQISTCCFGGVDASHESHSQSPLQVPSPDTFVRLNNLFRLTMHDGRPVRTVLTTGIPGIGMTVSVGKFALDWAEQRANKDLQFVIKLSFRTLWLLRNKNPSSSSMMSIMEIIESCYPEFKGLRYLEKEDCKFLIIMDSFDCYQVPLDWENAPVINDNYTQAHPDVLIVNILRGTVLRGAHIWILGRRAAVSQIPSTLIDVVTEIHGFSDEMKDNYLTRRFTDAGLAARIVAHYKRAPMLHMLARQPFVCWMVATLFERCYRYRGYGVHPPRLTPFYVNILIVQTNRRLQFYYGKNENELKWSSDDKCLLKNMGYMAFKMLMRRTSVFFEDDIKECDLNVTEVTALSGLCTELPAAASDGRRTFCFIHLTFQEFMAALYVFTMFHLESKNVLDSRKSMDQTKSPVQLVECALVKTIRSPLGQYDMFLRFLCGLLSPHCHNILLGGFLFPHNASALSGLDKVQQLLSQKIQTAPEDRVENLKECLREMTQADE